MRVRCPGCAKRFRTTSKDGRAVRAGEFCFKCRTPSDEAIKRLSGCVHPRVTASMKGQTIWCHDCKTYVS